MEIIHWCEIEGFGPFYGKIPSDPVLYFFPLVPSETAASPSLAVVVVVVVIILLHYERAATVCGNRSIIMARSNRV